MAWKNKTNVPARTRGKRETVEIDAAGQPVGRLATKVANILMGKHKPDYTPNEDTGAIVKIVNADKLVYTGKKWSQKVFFRSSNRPSGITRVPVAKLQAEKPGAILIHAVKFMLPKNRMQNERLKRLIIA